jgi:hypothetical protein
MSNEQRARVIEILTYIKRQASLRKQRLEFQLQLRQTEKMREELENNDQVDEYLSSDSEDDSRERTWFELLLDHLENSSLCIFPQWSFVR